MMVFATNNRNKLKEVAAILGEGVELTTPRELGVTEDIPETADTLEGNALQKAHFVHDRLLGDSSRVAQSGVAVATFADDTGMEVEVLGGEPGVYSARYAGPACSYVDNCELLLRNLKGAKNRRARFRTVVALVWDGEERLFEGEVRGTIAEEYHGDGGFGYDPIFVPDGFDRSFAEMSLEEKNKISHRARAIEKLKEFLER